MEDFEILFVDDDQTILSLVEEYLTAFDYRISIVNNALKALELIKDKEFDLVFTHGARAAFFPARLLKIALVVLADYEYVALPGFMVNWTTMIALLKKLEKDKVAFEPRCDFLKTNMFAIASKKE